MDIEGENGIAFVRPENQLASVDRAHLAACRIYGLREIQKLTVREETLRGQ